MINNNLCEFCGHVKVCKVADILAKFSEDAKKPLGVDITMDECENYEGDCTSNGKDE